MFLLVTVAEVQQVWGHPNKHFRNVEIASVNTLALLAATALPRKPREKTEAAPFLTLPPFRSLRLQDDADKIEYVCAFILGRFVPKKNRKNL